MEADNQQSIAVQAQAEVPADLDGSRLDRAAAQLFNDYSRERLKAWIGAGELTVNGAAAGRPRDPVHAGDLLRIEARLAVQEEVRAQPIELNLLHVDEDIAIINKPAGLTVHPGAGQADSTMQNALLHRFPQLAQVPRSGIVHRLDKDTSGLLVVALNLASHTHLVRALQAREIKREYDAIVHGCPTGGGTIEAPIGRHPTRRTRMAVVGDGRPSVTHFRVAERFAHHTHLAVQLETGRTHQIRVHLQHLRYPMVGDPVYGTRSVRGAGLSDALRAQVQRFGRQALHARRLSLLQPRSGEELRFEAPLPDDMQGLLAALRAEPAN